MICAMSIDGKIARSSSDRLDWIPREDRSFFARETKRVGVVVMGRKTHHMIGGPLPERRNIVFTRNPSLLLQEPVDNLRFSNEDPLMLLKRLEQEGHEEVAIIGGCQVNTTFLQIGAIEEMYLSIIPVILGGGIALFDGNNPNATFLQVSEETIGTQVKLLRYRVVYASRRACST
jgi:dihydrofolate reductase